MRIQKSLPHPLKLIFDLDSSFLIGDILQLTDNKNRHQSQMVTIGQTKQFVSIVQSDMRYFAPKIGVSPMRIHGKAL